jgi:hypothetical protein
MTERKPPGVGFETWVDRQIREAQERGVFEGLTGAGKPLAGLDATYDEMWWVKNKMRQENLTYLPPTLALRKEAEDAMEAALRAPSESQVRRIVAEINEKISALLAKPPPGPPLGVKPFDADEIVEHWQRRRGEQ